MHHVCIICSFAEAHQAAHALPTHAEVPFVATKDGYRNDGNCRRLMQVGMLEGQGGCIDFGSMKARCTDDCAS